MPPATSTLADACARLGLTVRQFRRSYTHLFSDARPEHLRGTSSPVLLYRVEVETACEPGGWERLAERRAAGVRRAKLVK